MKRFAIGSAVLLVFLLGSPAAWACDYLCTEVEENCWECVWTPGANAGCYQVGPCRCRDEQCWAPSAAQEKALTPEALGIFAPTPGGVSMSVARPASTR